VKVWLGAVAAVVVAGAAGPSCQPIPSPPGPTNPVNSCPTYPCSAFKQPGQLGLGQASCSLGQCISNSTLDFSLVVSLPETAFIDPSITVAIPQFYSLFLPSLTAPTQPDCEAPACVQVPQAILGSGSLAYSSAINACAGLQGEVTIPASATFRPRWTGPASSPIDATSIGLPLLPTLSSPSASGTPDWVAVLSQPWPVLDYEEDIVPVDDAYPPVRFIGPPFGPAVIQAPDVGECPSPGTTTFTVASDGPSLRGFQVYVRDPVTLERISSRATLGDVLSAPVTLLTALVSSTPSEASLQGNQLVIEPPAGLPIPTFVDTLPPASQLQSERFPILPEAVTVSGTVRDAAAPEGNPIEADLVITSVPGGIVDTDINAPNTQQALSYTTTAHSNPADGSYSVVLPPGTYEVYIAPVSGVAAGATTVQLEVAAPESGEPPAGAGKTLIASALWPITGTVTVADGRALSGALVEAHAAASIAGTDPRLWPRTVSTFTDANGGYALSVGPGTYDLVVEPIDGSGFPWTTTSSLSIPAAERSSFDVVVPAPIVVDLTLHDSGNNALPFAVVRAFAPSATAAPTDGGVPAQIPLGAWFTDQNGHFTMLLAPPN
jgi:hypothetical protein